MSRRYIAIAIVIILTAWALWYFLFGTNRININNTTVKAGILHSLTGTMAVSERSVVDATLLAIEEINQKGGVLGRRIEPVVVDGRSDWSVFAREAERLIKEEEVSVVFGCWTSACRKTVKPIFEKNNHLLIYPVQNEGLEQSPNIVYTGAAPNQQVIPAVKWSFDNLGKRFFLVGSDYVFPRTANEIIKDQLSVLGGDVIGEEYILLGSGDVKGIIEKIVNTQPDVILNTINGDSNAAFFRELHKSGITPEQIPTLSFSLAEDELRTLGVENMIGNYAAWNYFQRVDSEENKYFVRKFKKKFGSHRVTDDPMEACYLGVFLWAQAVEDAGTFDIKNVLESIRNQSLSAPEGMVYIDPENLHTWKTVRIAKIKEDGLFDIVWSSEKPIRPIPYPRYRSKLEWHEFLNGLYEMWGNKWANSGN